MSEFFNGINSPYYATAFGRLSIPMTGGAKEINELINLFLIFNQECLLKKIK